MSALFLFPPSVEHSCLALTLWISLIVNKHQIFLQSIASEVEKKGNFQYDIIVLMIDTFTFSTLAWGIEAIERI